MDPRIQKRPDWAAGRIKDATVSTLRMAWLFTTVWNLISAPVILTLPREYARGNYWALLAGIFPLIGVGLLVWSIRVTLRWKRFGTSIFEMSTVPGSIAGRLEGTIRTRLDPFPAEGVHLVLRCIHRYTTGRGKNTHPTEKILWQEDRDVPLARVGMDDRGAAISVSFEIPSDCRETNSENPRDRILWRLEAGASLPGVDYHTLFEVPVFGATEETPGARPEARTARPVPGTWERPRNSRIRVAPVAGGGTEFLFPAARNPRAALSTTVFLLLFSGLVAVFLHFIPTKGGMFFSAWSAVFLVAFALVGLLLIISVLALWLQVTRVVVGSGRVTITNSICGLRSTRSIPLADIASIKPRIGMQLGRTPFYDISILRGNGKKVTAGTGIRDKREAEALATEMTRHLP